MRQRVSVLQQIAIAASIIGGILFGFVTSVAWLVLVLQMLPLSAWQAGDLTLAGIFGAILSVGISCWLCGSKAQKWAERRFANRE